MTEEESKAWNYIMYPQVFDHYIEVLDDLHLNHEYIAEFDDATEISRQENQTVVFRDIFCKEDDIKAIKAAIKHANEYFDYDVEGWLNDSSLTRHYKDKRLTIKVIIPMEKEDE